MDTRIPPTSPNVVAITTTARATPRPVRVQFSQVLATGASTLVRGAEAAMKSLPGAPLLAVAVRGGTGMMPGIPRAPSASVTVGAARAEGPPGGVAGAGVGGAEGVPGAAGAAGDGGVESSLAQAQEMNLYYLQIQEAVNAQNRTFSALSNVLKAEHDTVKTAIGNIR